MRIEELIAVIEGIAPPEHAASWDRCGVQVAARRRDVRKVAVTLDPAARCVDRAIQWGADFVLTHHPLALKPDLPDQVDAHHHVLSSLLSHDVWLYAAHTSLDVQPSGPVRWLAGKLGLNDVSVLEPTGAIKPRWFRVLGQEAALETLRTGLDREPGLEIFSANSQALEIVCSGKLVSRVRALVQLDGSESLRMLSQELEHPAVTVGFGFVGFLPEPLAWGELAPVLGSVLNQPFLTLAGQAPEMVYRVACCPGSGASMLSRVSKVRADVFITGDLKFHDARKAEEMGLFVVDAGHHGLEEPMMMILADDLHQALAADGVEVEFFPSQDAFNRISRSGEKADSSARPA